MAEKRGWWVDVSYPFVMEFADIDTAIAKVMATGYDSGVGGGFRDLSFWYATEAKARAAKATLEAAMGDGRVSATLTVEVNRQAV